ncbi:MAG: hypothetical protein WC254_00905 [Candidatus Woesearchaeota archaeon]|jgi:hypothetical protein
MIWSFLNNPWISGIGGGLISGIIVFFVTNYILSRKENKLYLQKIDQANLEVIHILKPYVTSEKPFNLELFNSVISSVSKRYNVESNDIIKLEEALNEIVTDIMQTSFLTEEQKETYCKKLLSLKQTPKQIEKIIYLKKDETTTVSSKNFSLVLAMTTVLITMLTMMFFSFRDSMTNFSRTPTSFMILVTSIPIFLTLVMMMMLDMRKKLKLKLKDSQEKE